MTEIDRLDRQLTAWFVETASPRLPDYVDDILRQTAPVRQRPRWTFLERWLPMIVPLRTVSRGTSPWRRIALVAVLIVIMLAAALAIVASQRRVPPPFGPAANGRLALSANGDVHTVDPATGVTQPIAIGPPADHDPRFSRDGTRIAFLRDTGDEVAIVVADADGRNQKVVTPEPFGGVDGDGIMWSPDGRWIAVNARLPATSLRGNERLFIVDAIEGGVRELAVDYVAAETYWRPPDGRQLLFQGRRDDLNGLYLVTPSDGAVERLPITERESGIRPLGWSPDGRAVIYQLDDPTSSESGTRILDLATGRETTLAVEYGHLSNDGRSLAGIVGDRLCIVSVDGGPCRAIGNAHTVPQGTASHSLYWSPDDQWIVTWADESDGAVLIDAGGGGVTLVPWFFSGAESWQRVVP
jgi:dipeptidyl aminopeptidase/acylaminoacyl peptidase